MNWSENQLFDSSLLPRDLLSKEFIKMENSELEIPAERDWVNICPAL